MSMALKVVSVRRRVQQGDPGLFSFIGKAIHAISGVVGSLGIPIVSGIANKVNQVTGMLTGGGGVTAVAPVLLQAVNSAPSNSFPGAAGGMTVGPGVSGGVGIRLPGGGQFSMGGAASMGAGGGGGIMMPGGGVQSTALANARGQACGMKGYHVNKQGYFMKGTRDGSGPHYVEKGSKCVKNRRRNPLNPRALSRGMHRLLSFKHASVRAEQMLNRLATKHHRALPPGVKMVPKIAR